MNPEVAELLTELNLLELKIRQEIFLEIFKEEIPDSNTDDIYRFALEAARNCAAKEMFPDRPDLKGSGLSAAIQERAMEETGEVDTEKVKTRQLDYMVASHKICIRLCKEYNQKLGDARMAFFTQNVEGVKYTAKAQALNDRLMQEGRANLKAKMGELKSTEYAGHQLYQTRCCSEGMPYHSVLCLPGVALTCDGCQRQFPMSVDLVAWMDCDENYDICQSCILFKCRYCKGPCCCEIRC
jgi:hypothetical protein